MLMGTDGGVHGQVQAELFLLQKSYASTDDAFFLENLDTAPAG